MGAMARNGTMHTYIGIRNNKLSSLQAQGSLTATF